MMKMVFFSLLLFFISSCKPSPAPDLESPLSIMDNAADNPCVKCTENLRHAQMVCLEKAGTDRHKIQSCNNNAGALWLRECRAVCVMPEGTDTSGAIINIPTARKNPCVQCTERLQKELKECLQLAGDDPARREACTMKADEKWFTNCQPICGKNE